MRVKNKFMKTKRIFDDDMIATIDKTTEKRTNLVSSLLGNSREAQDISSQFIKMVQMPSEDFNLKNYKLLTEQLSNKVRKPDPVYQFNARINPKLTKNKFAVIEDYITIQPKSTEVVHPPLDQSLFTSIEVDNDSQEVIKQGTVSIEDKEATLAITDDPTKD